MPLTASGASEGAAARPFGSSVARLALVTGRPSTAAGAQAAASPAAAGTVASPASVLAGAGRSENDPAGWRRRAGSATHASRAEQARDEREERGAEAGGEDHRDAGKHDQAAAPLHGGAD